MEILYKRKCVILNRNVADLNVHPVNVVVPSKDVRKRKTRKYLKQTISDSSNMIVVNQKSLLNHTQHLTNSIAQSSVTNVAIPLLQNIPKKKGQVNANGLVQINKKTVSETKSQKLRTSKVLLNNPDLKIHMKRNWSSNETGIQQTSVLNRTTERSVTRSNTKSLNRIIITPSTLDTADKRNNNSILKRNTNPFIVQEIRDDNKVQNSILPIRKVAGDNVAQNIYKNTSLDVRPILYLDETMPLTPVKRVSSAISENKSNSSKKMKTNLNVQNGNQIEINPNTMPKTVITTEKTVCNDDSKQLEEQILKFVIHKHDKLLKTTSSVGENEDGILHNCSIKEVPISNATSKQITRPQSSATTSSTLVPEIVLTPSLESLKSSAPDLRLAKISTARKSFKKHAPTILNQTDETPTVVITKLNEKAVWMPTAQLNMDARDVQFTSKPNSKVQEPKMHQQPHTEDYVLNQVIRRPAGPVQQLVAVSDKLLLSVDDDIAIQMRNRIWPETNANSKTTLTKEKVTRLSAPILTVTKGACDGAKCVEITWTMPWPTEPYIPIKYFEIFATERKDLSRVLGNWEKLINITYETLPANITLFDLPLGKIYSFCIRAVDVLNCQGEFSEVKSVSLRDDPSKNHMGEVFDTSNNSI